MSIYDLYKSKNNKQEFRLKNTCMLALQMINRLEYIHSKNIIHWDIKPDNFVTGRKNPQIIYLIDFGFAIKYKSSRTGKHIQFWYLKKYFGSLKYVSINANNYYRQSRRDDLESLGYMLIFLLTGNLPWLNLLINESINYTEKYRKILKLKKNKPEILFKGLNNQFIDYIKYCRNLAFEEDPNYDYLRSLFTSILIRNNLKNDLNFFWLRNKIENKSKDKGYKRKDSSNNRLYKKIKLSLEIKNNFKKLNSFPINNNFHTLDGRNNYISFLNERPSNNEKKYPVNDKIILEKAKRQFKEQVESKNFTKLVNNIVEKKKRNTLTAQKISIKGINSYNTINLENKNKNINKKIYENPYNKIYLNTNNDSKKYKRISIIKNNILNFNSKSPLELTYLGNNTISSQNNYNTLEERKIFKIYNNVSDNYYVNNNILNTNYY